MPPVNITYMLEHKYLRSVTYKIMLLSSPPEKMQEVRFKAPGFVTLTVKVAMNWALLSNP